MNSLLNSKLGVYRFVKVLCHNAASDYVEIKDSNFNLIKIYFDYPSRPDFYHFYNRTRFLIIDDTLKPIL